MISKDKTGDRLLASIRKSKSGMAAGKAAAPSAENAVAGKSQTTMAVQASFAGTEPRRQSTETVAKDNYSLGRRVWPD